MAHSNDKYHQKLEEEYVDHQRRNAFNTACNRSTSSSSSLIRLDETAAVRAASSRLMFDGTVVVDADADDADAPPTPAVALSPVALHPCC